MHVGLHNEDRPQCRYSAVTDVRYSLRNNGRPATPAFLHLSCLCGRDARALPDQHPPFCPALFLWTYASSLLVQTAQLRPFAPQLAALALCSKPPCIHPILSSVLIEID